MIKILLISLFISNVFTATENEKTVWEFLKKNGLTDAGAAGLMGNLFAESAINSVIYENIYKAKLGLSDQEYVDVVNRGTYKDFVTDQVGFGLAQWTYYTRKQALLDKCKGKIGDLKCQLSYLMDEFNTDFVQILDVLKTSDDVRTCSDLVMVEFENPEDQSPERKNGRYNYSLGYYKMFSEGGNDDENPDTGDYITYTIVSGDTLYEISKKYGTTIEAIAELNGIANPNAIYVGQIIKIPKNK